MYWERACFTVMLDFVEILHVRCMPPQAGQLCRDLLLIYALVPVAGSTGPAFGPRSFSMAGGVARGGMSEHIEVLGGWRFSFHVLYFTDEVWFPGVWARKW